MFTALLDTCVLWPSVQRDFLLSLAIEGLYRPVWSDAILEELERNEQLKLVRRGADPLDASQRAAWLISQMRTQFEDARVAGWGPLVGAYDLPDPDDEHVVAAAVVSAAGVIVTHNLKDFPPNKVPSHIEVIEPPEFTYNTVAVDPGRAQVAIGNLLSRSGRHGPKLTREELFEIFKDRYRMTDTMALLEQHNEPG